MNDWRELEAPTRAEIEVEACGRTTTHRPASSKTRQILRTGAQETRIRVRNTGTTPVTVRYRARGTIEDDDWTVDHRGTLGTVLAGRQDSWTVMPNADVEIAARPEVVEIPIDEYRDLATPRDKEEAGNPGERLFERYIAAKGLRCRTIPRKKKKKTPDLEVDVDGIATTWEIKSLRGSQDIRDALEQDGIHAWTHPDSRWTKEDGNEDRIDKAERQMSDASSHERPTVIGLINRQDDYDPAALSGERIAGMLYGDEIAAVTGDHAEITRREHEENTALANVSAIAVLSVTTPTIPFHGKNFTDMCRDTVRLCGLEIYHNRNANVELDRNAVRAAGIVQHEWDAAEPREALVSRGPMDTSTWDVIPFTEDTLELAQRTRRDEAVQRFVCSVNDSITEAIADAQKQADRENRNQVPISRRSSVVWTEDNPIDRSKLRNVTITPDERARVRGTNRPVTEVLQEVLTAPDSPPTKEQKTAASYAAIRIEELRGSTTANPLNSAHRIVRERIEEAPGRCGGRPTIRGTRIAVNVILGRIGSGAVPNETTEGLPVAPGDVVTTMAYALEVIVRDEALKQGRKERT